MDNDLQISVKAQQTLVNHKYNYSAEAIGELKVCVFEQKMLDKYLDQNPVLAKELLNQTSFELTLAQDRVTVLGKLNAIERIARFFSMYLISVKELAGKTILLALQCPG